MTLRWSLLLAILFAAVVQAQQAQRQVPGMPPGYLFRSEEAAIAYERARIHTELGSAYYGAGQMAIAMDEFNIAIAAEPRYVPAHYMLGLVYMDLNDDVRAEQAFKKALELDPGNPEARNNYGWFLCQRNRIDESLKEFAEAVRNPLYGTPEMAYVNAGLCSLKRNDERAAEEYFLKALRVRPAHPQALFHLAEIYYRANDLPGARAQLLTYLRSNNPTPEVLWLGVRIERKLGDVAAQSSYAQMLRQRFPTSREAQALAAGLYE